MNSRRNGSLRHHGDVARESIYFLLQTSKVYTFLSTHTLVTNEPDSTFLNGFFMLNF